MNASLTHTFWVQQSPDEAFAAMERGETTHDRQSKSGPIAATAISVIRLHERVAELGQVLLGDTDAVISHPDSDSAILTVFRPNVHLRHFAGGHELHCIAY